MKLVGGDIGYYQRETIVDSLTIAPAERYIVDISASKSGKYTLTHLGGYDPVALATIDVLTSSGSSIHSGDFATLHTHDILGTLSGSIAAYYSKIPDKSLTIGMTMRGMGGMGNNM